MSLKQEPSNLERSGNLGPRGLRRCRTIGHGNRTLKELIECLTAHGVDGLVDVRRYPASRRNPQFNKKLLGAKLRSSGISYRHVEALGGRRHGGEDRHTLLRSTQFRAYAQHMLSPEFTEAIGTLVRTPDTARLCLMCAEVMYFRCHRRLISDWLLANGIEVIHIISAGEAIPHRLTEGAAVVDSRPVYENPTLI